MPYETSFLSPLGPLRINADEHAITGIAFGSSSREDSHPLLARASDALRAWFAGEEFLPDLPLAPAGTAFQCAVWSALQRIPPGETRTYSEIACEIGRPAAVRAIGAANGRNPIMLLIPCHRVIGSDGTLTGYAGGVDRKRWLLAHEAMHLDRRAA